MTTWVSARGTRWAAIALALLWAAPAFAQQTAVKVDPSRTTIEFTLGAALHEVHGMFALKSGAMEFDPATGLVSGSLVVDATSGTTGNRSRDHKMHADVLESEQYPEIVFLPTSLEGKLAPEGDSQVNLQGQFRLHGQSRGRRVHAKVHVTDKHWTADMDFPVSYEQWGMKNPSTFIMKVSSTAHVRVHAEGVLRRINPS